MFTGIRYQTHLPLFIFFYPSPQQFNFSLSLGKKDRRKMSSSYFYHVMVSPYSPKYNVKLNNLPRKREKVILIKIYGIGSAFDNLNKTRWNFLPRIDCLLPCAVCISENYVQYRICERKFFDNKGWKFLKIFKQLKFLFLFKNFPSKFSVLNIFKFPLPASDFPSKHRIVKSKKLFLERSSPKRRGVEMKEGARA